MKTSLTPVLTGVVLACVFLPTTAMAEVLTACCLPFPQAGCQNLVTPAACEAMGGWSFGACADCADFGCPPAACIGATESCDVPHSTPGCDDWVCCNYVCAGWMPECCDPAHGWDESCVEWMNQNECSWDNGHHSWPACLPDGSCQWFSDDYWTYLQGGQQLPADNAGDPLPCQGDQDGDGIDNACGCPSDVPAMSSHGMIVGAVLLLVASAAFLLWRRRATS
jgi:hypothetical protein